MSAKNPEKKIKKSDKTENFDLPEQPENIQRPGSEVVEKGMLT